MALREWLQPPRRLIALFLLVTLVPSTALVVLGWRLLEQDRALSLNQLSERREQAADLAVLELEHVVAGAEHALESPESLAAVAGERDAVGVIFGIETVRALPAERLAFYPRTEAGPEAPAQRFAEGEDLEFRQQDWARAMRIYRRLARSPDADVRAGALIRLARLLRQSGDREEALEVYSEVSRVSGVSVGGVPADLLARWARCGLLETLHRDRELQDEARALRLDLQHGRWRLDRAIYELHADEVKRWAREEYAVEGGESRLALAFAVEMLWNDWRRQALDRRGRSSRRVIDTPTGPVTVISAGTEERLSALLVGREHIETQWLAKITPVLDRQRLRLALRDSSVRGGASGSEARRAAADTGLPWTVVVREVDPQGELGVSPGGGRSGCGDSCFSSASPPAGS